VTKGIFQGVREHEVPSGTTRFWEHAKVHSSDIRKEPMMQKRKLGNSDLEITPMGLGAWAIGGGGWEFGWGAQEDTLFTAI
jgi:hypothetical protein